MTEKGDQDTINLVAVDSQRISEFASFNHQFPSSVLRLVVACVLLLNLLGWKPLLAGLAAAALVIPFSAFFGGRFAAAQCALMETRDKRTEVVTEVIQNIRQIKFSAIEEGWKNRVFEARQFELNQLLRTLFYVSCLELL